MRSYALVLGEQSRKRLLDGSAALEVLAALIGVIAVSSPEAGHRLGVALVEGDDESFGTLEEGIALSFLFLLALPDPTANRGKATVRDRSRRVRMT